MKPKKAFWDSSALVGLCIKQETSKNVSRLIRRYDAVVWWATPVEISSAIERLHRTGELDAKAKQYALGRLSILKQGWSEISPRDPLRQLAEMLLSNHVLRAADSLQLAAALTWCQLRPMGREFICSDSRLCEAASEVGFTVLHPGNE